jgi:hypothetical protein
MGISCMVDEGPMPDYRSGDEEYWLKNWDRLTTDQRAKFTMRIKQILAEVLIGAVDEFRGMERSEVERRIPGDGRVAVTSDPVLDTPGEKRALLDNVFDIEAPGGDERMIIALDLQGRRLTAEDLIPRLTMYTAKTYSAQAPLGLPKYRDLRRTRLIWIDVNPAESNRNSIFYGRMKYEKGKGGPDAGLHDPGLMTVTYIGLHCGSAPTGNRLLDLLNILMNDRDTVESRVEELAKYDIDASPLLIRGMENMETLAEQFRLNYIEEGIEIGKEIGREEGRKIEMAKTEVEFADAVRRLISRGFTLEEALDIACPDRYRSGVLSILEASDRFPRAKRFPFFISNRAWGSSSHAIRILRTSSCTDSSGPGLRWRKRRV